MRVKHQQQQNWPTDSWLNDLCAMQTSFLAFLLFFASIPSVRERIRILRWKLRRVIGSRVNSQFSQDLGLPKILSHTYRSGNPGCTVRVNCAVANSRPLSRSAMGDCARRRRIMMDIISIDWCCFYCFIRNSLVALLECHYNTLNVAHIHVNRHTYTRTQRHTCTHIHSCIHTLQLIHSQEGHFWLYDNYIGSDCCECLPFGIALP